MGKYIEELTRAMNYLAKDERTIFLGQVYGALPKTLVNVPPTKIINFPVAEEMQLGVSTGLALAGFVPVSFYIRSNFLLCAINQLVNHLDKIRGYTPRVIIRTTIGADRPIDPGNQHTGDFTEALRLMCGDRVRVVLLNDPEEIFEAYKKALHSIDGRSTLFVEDGNAYNEK